VVSVWLLFGMSATVAHKLMWCNSLCKQVWASRTGPVTKTPELIGSAAACDLLGIDRSTLSRWITDGRVTPVMKLSEGVTGAHVFKRADIEALRAEREAAS
jgi:hypothetical protein